MTKDAVGDSINTFLHKLLKDLKTQQVQLHFGDKEQQVLRMFYDERMKVRKDKVAQFQIYARICEGKDDDQWALIMSSADVAIHNLKVIGYSTEDSPSSSTYTSVRTSLGRAAVLYTLTAKGLEVLQNWHPDVALRVRAWIAVLPPWLVLIGSIAGGVSSLWKFTDLARRFTP